MRVHMVTMIGFHASSHNHIDMIGRETCQLSGLDSKKLKTYLSGDDCCWVNS
jgi:hypothetical protein